MGRDSKTKTPNVNHWCNQRLRIGGLKEETTHWMNGEVGKIFGKSVGTLIFINDVNIRWVKMWE